MKMKNALKRAAAAAMAVLMLFSVLPGDLFPMSVEAAEALNKTADPSTAMSYKHMLGTDIDGNRYAGRIWVDKSVHTGNAVTYDGFTATNTSGKDDEFIVSYSALGSTTSISTTTTVSTTQPRDIVLVIDTSTSMSQMEGSGQNRKTRLRHVVEAADKLVGELSDGKNRIGVVTYNNMRHSVTPLDFYTDMGIAVTADGQYTGYNNTSGSIRVTGKLNAGTEDEKTVSFNHTGRQGTNIQAGIDAGAEMLRNAENQSGRAPVLIVLTDGEAYGADNNTWSNPGDVYFETDRGAVIFTTILNAAYNKVAIEKEYGVKPLIYTVSVDLDDNNLSHAIMDPEENFNSSFNNDDVENAYDYFEYWKSRNSVVYIRNGSPQTNRPGGSYWTVEQVPAGVTKQEVLDNIGYADEYFNVQSDTVDLGNAFDTIIEQIKSGSSAFHPITDTTASGDQHRETPLTYVDPIGDYMELRNILKVTLFGKEYTVTKGTPAETTTTAGGVVLHTVKTPYTVGTSTDMLQHPITGESVGLQDSLWIELTETYTTSDGIRKTSVSDQELRIFINEEALPLLKSEVTNIDGDITYTETDAVPVRVYYTVGISGDILADDGTVLVSRIDSDYLTNNTDANGNVSLYTNQFGVLAPNEGTELLYGDAHAAVTPSEENRYYYHKTNFPVYLNATNADNSPIDWDEEEFGVLWYAGDGTNEHYEEYKNPEGYKLDMMTLADIQATAADKQVYTFISFYRPTTGGKGEAVTYLAYTTWNQLSQDCGFFDTKNQVYINGYDSVNRTYTTSADFGYAVDPTIALNYAAANGLTADQIAVCLGIHSWRQSRLDNMIEEKTENTTATAEEAYAPKYNADTAHAGDLVVWLGNNGKLVVDPTQGFSLTKKVTGNVDATEFEFKIEFLPAEGSAQLPDFTPSVRTGYGTAVADGKSSWDAGAHTLTVKLAADETVYVIGVPKNVKYEISENTTGNFNVVITDDLNTNNDDVYEGVIVNNAFTNVTATNTEKGKGGVFITKVVEPTNGVSAPNGDKFAVTATIVGNKNVDLLVTSSRTDANGDPIVLNKDATAASDTTYKYENTGSAEIITLLLEHNETVHINGLSHGAVVTVDETDIPDGAYGDYTKNGLTDDDDVVNDGIVNIVEYVNDSVVVHNTYTPDTTSVDIQGNIIKVFDAYANFTDFEFKFDVQEYKNGGWESVYANPFVIDQDDFTSNSVTFADSSISVTGLTEPGTRYFRILELDGGNADITYDPSIFTFALVVEEDANTPGKLTAKLVNLSANAGTDPDEFKVEYDEPNNIWNVAAKFTNEYHTAIAYMDIVKTITDESVSGKTPADFTFEVYEAAVDADGAWTQVGTDPIRTGITDVAGKLRFTRTFTGSEFPVGDTYRYYIVKENTVSLTSGWTSDDVVYHVTLKVNKADDGTITAEFTEISPTATFTATAATLAFHNTYDATAAEIAPSVTKKLDGRKIMDGETFTFGIFDGDTKVSEITVTGDGLGNEITGTFPKMTFDKVGTYRYTVKEIAGSNGAITYSTEEYDLVVTVTDKGGVLEATYIYENAVTQTPVFTNKYNAAGDQVVIGGLKTVKGVDGEAYVLQPNSFAFKLTDGETNGVTLYTANRADGTFSFAPITYTQADMGGALEKTFNYTVSEIKPTTNALGGIDYSQQIFNVSITVTDNGNGQLEAGDPVITKDNSGADIAFVNDYDATFETGLTVSGSKLMTGRDLFDGEFTFVLLENGQEIKTASNDDSGVFAFTFEKDYFKKAGTHHYVIAEKIPENKANGVQYSTQQYNITVNVVDHGNGDLTATAVYNGAVLNNEDQITFTNSYDPTDVKIVINGNKVLKESNDLKANDFSFSLYATDEKYENVSEDPVWTVSNAANGEFVSPEGTFTRAYDGYYILVEEPYDLIQQYGGTYVKDDIFYDNSVHKVHIVVSDKDDQGNYLADLVATVEIDGVKYESNAGKVEAGPVTFTNVYDPEEGITLTKKVVGDVGETEFKFEIKFLPDNGTTLSTPSVTSSAVSPSNFTWDNATQTLTVTLTADEKVHVFDVPKDVKFEIREITTGNFNVVINDELDTNTDSVYEGVIVDKVFTNITATNTEKAKGGVYITKEVESTVDGVSVPNGDKFTVTATVTGNKSTDFTVTAYKFDADGKRVQSVLTKDTVPSDTAYKYEKDGEDEVFTFSIGNDETVYINGLTDSATVTVAESTMPNNSNGTYVLDSLTDNDAAADGTVTVAENENDSVVVLNKYTPKATSIDIKGKITKLFEDHAQIPNFEFEFVVEEYMPGKDPVWQKTGNSLTVDKSAFTSSSVTVDSSTVSITGLTEPGSRYFQIRELDGGNADITYDPSIFTFELLVKKDPSVPGKLIAELINLSANAGTTADDFKVTYDNGIWNVEAEFVNEYHTAAASMDIKKKVDDQSQSGKTPAEFTFEVYEAAVNGNVWTQGNKIREGITDAAGELRFARTFTHSDFGTDDTIKTKTLYYIVKEKVPTPVVPGWTYDGTEYHVTLELSRTNESSPITAKFTSITSVGGSSAAQFKDASATLNFMNVYDAVPAIIEPPMAVSKQLEGRFIAKDEKFEFGIFDGNNQIASATVKGDGTSSVAQNAFTFVDGFKFDKVGTYRYTVKEIVDPATKNNAITYSDEAYNLVVNVTDNNGKLEASYFYENATTQTPVFTNKYHANGTQVVIEGVKDLDGEARELHANEFIFKLEGTNLAEPLYAFNEDDGTFKFDPIYFTQANMGGALTRNFVYKVTEVVGRPLGGIEYDTTEYTVTVTVTDNGKGQLEAAVTGAANIKFTNTYDAKLETPLKIYGTKAMTGRELVNGEKYTFVLYDESGKAVQRVQNEDSGIFTLVLDKEDLTEKGTYKFVLKEEIPDDANKIPGVIYDTTEYEITVVVDDDGYGRLSASAFIGSDDLTSASQLTFTNKYDPKDVKVILNGVKVLENRDKALEADEFSFSMYKTDEHYNVVDTTPIWTVENAETTGKFTAPESTFDEAFDGYFIIVEEPYDKVQDGSYIKDGILYDDVAHQVHIVVSDKDANGNYLAELVATVEVDGNTFTSANGVVTVDEDYLKFINKYDPDDTEIEIGEGTTADITTNKALSGKVLNAGDFEFALSEAKVSANNEWTKVKELATAKNTETGGFVFKTLEFDKVGTYYYIVEEVDSGKGGIVYDDTLYYVTVEVTDDQEGHLVAKTSIKTNKSDDPAEMITFKNSYVIKENDKLKLTGVKKLTGADLKKNQFSFELYSANDKFEKDKKLDTAKNDADGKIEFTARKLKNPGTYYYVVTEKAGNEQYVTYDTAVWNITVVAEDNGEGELVLTTTVVAAGTTEDKGVFTFVNKYEEPAPVPTPTPTPTPTPEATATPEPTVEPTATPAPSDVPETGDNSNIMLWIAALAAAIVGVIATMFVYFTKKGKRASGKHYR